MGRRSGAAPKEVSQPIQFKPAAERDIESASQWYDEQRPGLGQEFLDEVDAAVWRVAANPRAHQLIRGRIRRAVVHRFPFLLFYVIDPQEIRLPRMYACESRSAVMASVKTDDLKDAGTASGSSDQFWRLHAVEKRRLRPRALQCASRDGAGGRRASRRLFDGSDQTTLRALAARSRARVACRCIHSYLSSVSSATRASSPAQGPSTPPARSASLLLGQQYLDLA
ncbi:MAG TPA: type II toxin-antitoxin system RelE/ParE family toxin [Thermoanaerobaculia bacterium]